MEEENWKKHTLIASNPDKENKFVLDPAAISNTAADLVEEQKRHVSEPLKNSLTSTSMPSTEKKVVLTVVVAETPQQHTFFIFQLYDFPIDLFNPGGTTTTSVCDPHDWFSKFLNPCYVVFDPGGDEYRFRSSPTSNLGNFYSTTLLQMPWDRGKLSVYEPLFAAFVRKIRSITSLAIVLFLARGAASGLPWVPWSSKNADECTLIVAVRHVKGEDEVLVQEWREGVGQLSIKLHIMLVAPLAIC
ncbi:hypothetical protein TSUD_258320 [Trifolium subterraneum]|uniref:Uncharacterized protein n=1 Tax=Trifolium subterraneum TaxID=3900 RepID=A0A2Z6P873_TRISU|nr:hypothetical protein TSUD_258320 [Trifolium subterraneum]